MLQEISAFFQSREGNKHFFSLKSSGYSSEMRYNFIYKLFSSSDGSLSLALPNDSWYNLKYSSAQRAGRSPQWPHWHDSRLILLVVQCRQRLAGFFFCWFSGNAAGQWKLAIEIDVASFFLFPISFLMITSRKSTRRAVSLFEENFLQRQNAFAKHISRM